MDITVAKVIEHLKSFYKETDANVYVSYDGIRYFCEGMFVWDYSKRVHIQTNIWELKDALGTIPMVKEFAQSLTKVKLILK